MTNISRGIEQGNRVSLALSGKTYCKVDANYSVIDIGDLMITHATDGHAMKATNPTAAFGAVIGKALGPLHEGKGVIPILVALQLTVEKKLCHSQVSCCVQQSTCIEQEEFRC